MGRTHIESSKLVRLIQVILKVETTLHRTQLIVAQVAIVVLNQQHKPQTLIKIQR